MNENAELIKYLDIAENVYENMYEKYQITDNPVTNLNRVMAEIRKEGLCCINIQKLSSPQSIQI